MGANGIAKYLENHGIHKIARQNGTNPLFDAALIRRIIQNPVYCGKISYGRRRTEKVHGTRNEYRQVRKEDYLLVDGFFIFIFTVGATFDYFKPWPLLSMINCFIRRIGYNLICPAGEITDRR